MNFWKRNDFNSRTVNPQNFGTQGFNNQNGSAQNYGGRNCNSGYGVNSTYNAQNDGNGTYNAQNVGEGCNFSEQDVRSKMEQYSGKSEDQLMNELTGMVARMKSEGTFDPSAVENLFNTASPFLNETQRERMRSIIDMLKG